MTAACPAGAVSRRATDWHAIPWRKVHRVVRRLQARIVQAVQAGRWGKVNIMDPFVKTQILSNISGSRCLFAHETLDTVCHHRGCPGTQSTPGGSCPQPHSTAVIGGHWPAFAYRLLWAGSAGPPQARF
jgi:hypothetical protein